jgi:hypothetical protein
MEDEELGREKGDLLRYLIRVAILLSGAALVLQLLFLGWLVISPDTVPDFAGMLFPLGGEATTDARLVNVAQHTVLCMGLLLSFVFFSRAVACSAQENAQPATAPEGRRALRAAGILLLLVEPVACAVKALLALLLSVSGVTLQPGGAAIVAAILLLWSAREKD